VTCFSLYALQNYRFSLLSIGEMVFVLSLGFFWILGYINAYNFMDGINGIATMQLIITSVGTLILGHVIDIRLDDIVSRCFIILIISGLVFLPYNIYKPKMFLGDVGSTVIGYYIAVLCFWYARDHGWWLLGALGLMHANFIYDTLFTVLRRIYLGQKWYEPHREFYFHKLVRSGKSHHFVTSLESILQTFNIFIVIYFVKLGWNVSNRIICTIIVTFV